MNAARYVLTFSCPDRHGLVAMVTRFLAENNYNIEESSQYEDRVEKRFFMRTEFSAANDNAIDVEQLRQQFAPLAQNDEMEWSLCDLSERPKLVLAVSRWGHCLNTLLHNTLGQWA